MGLDDHGNRFQRLTGLTAPRVIILALLGTLVVAALVSFAIRSERHSRTAAQHTIAAVESARYAFKVSQLTHRSLRAYEQALEQQDLRKLAEARNLMGAALGFTTSPFAQERERIAGLQDWLVEMQDIIVQAGLSPTDAQRAILDQHINAIDRETIRYEQITQNRFQMEFYLLETVEYRNGVITRVTAVSILAALVICAVLLVFMRAEQIQSNKRIAAETASKAKSAFLANMSHEIRTPMNGIVGMVELLRQSPMTDDQVQMVDNMRDSAFFLLRIIDDILDAAKIDAGKIELENIPFNLMEAVERTSETLALEARKQNVRFQVYVDPDVPYTVLGDPLRLRQILLNLLSNAIKFSKREDATEGKVQLWINASPTQDRLHIRVIDKGIGMSPEVVDQLFRPFNQAEESTTRKFGGTGLGLVITRNLVELMGGEISVNSTVGEGSSFWVSLPLTVAPGKSKAPDVQSVKVLIYMDRPQFNSRMSGNLGRRGADTYCIDDQQTLLDAVRQADDQTVVLLGRLTLDENMILVDTLREENPDCRILVMDDTRGNPKGLIAPSVYVSYRFPMHHADLLRGLAVLTGRMDAGRPVLSAEKNRPTPAAQLLERADDQPAPVVLVVEDNPLNLSVITRQLKQLGLDCETATDGAAGLEQWQNGNFSAILSDCQMPVMDGLEMTRKIRAIEAANGQPAIPILAISASALPEEEERSLAAGMSVHLAKPMRLDQLSQELQHWLNLKPTDQAADQPGEHDTPATS